MDKPYGQTIGELRAILVKITTNSSVYLPNDWLNIMKSICRTRSQAYDSHQPNFNYFNDLKEIAQRYNNGNIMMTFR